MHRLETWNFGHVPISSMQHVQNASRTIARRVQKGEISYGVDAIGSYAPQEALILASAYGFALVMHVRKPSRVKDITLCESAAKVLRKSRLSEPPAVALFIAKTANMQHFPLELCRIASS